MYAIFLKTSWHNGLPEYVSNTIKYPFFVEHFYSKKPQKGKNKALTENTKVQRL